VRILTARWVFPVARPPIWDGAVGIHAGRIVAVGRRAAVVAECAGGERWDLGEAALLPGLVNCHTHLEIGSNPSGGPAEAFVPWVQRLIESRKSVGLDEQARTAEAGAWALLHSGATSVGEVSTTGQSLAPLLRVGLRGVVYLEILGLDPAEAADRLAAAAANLRAMAAAARGSRLAIGLSPHSAYALSEELLSACGSLVRKTGVPPAIHAAESPAETELLATGEGPIARSLYPAVGRAAPPPRRRARSPIAYLAAIGALLERPVLIHAVHVDEADCRLMAGHGVRVAHCPRSNRRLSEGTAPVPQMRGHSIPVGLGTDSLASAPDLDLWGEMRAAWAAHAAGLKPAAVLEMATLGGARALGLADRVGTLEIGKRADVIAVAAERVTATDPVGALLESTRGGDVLLVLIDGAVRHTRCEVPTCA
jgi:cytosine/adenosine deaminase-related metal-dependent hydrolase